MANAVEKVNTIAIADIEAINTITDDNLQALNTLEFTGAPADAHTWIATATSDGSDTSLGFVDGTGGVVLDNTYDVYEFHFINMHPETENAQFSFQVSAAGTFTALQITSTAWNVYQGASKAADGPKYEGDKDQANGTAYQSILSRRTGGGSNEEQSVSGILRLYAPSSTTYVKHFMSEGHGYHFEDYSLTMYVAGYINTELAITQIDFEFDNGEIQGDSEIKMYGLAKS